jgi:tetratricopeptide (TPR) repeat protein
LERLAERGEQEALQARHAAYYVLLAEDTEPKLRNREQLRALASLDREYDNLQAALAWCVASPGHAEAGARMASALFQYWRLRGLWSEGRMWMARMLKSIPNQPTRIRAHLALDAANLAQYQGDMASADKLIAEAGSLSEELNDLYTTACVLAFGNNEASLEESLRGFRLLGDDWQTALLLSNLASFAIDSADLDRAKILLDEALRLNKSTGDRSQHAGILLYLGAVAGRWHDYDEAVRLLTHMLAVLEDAGFKRLVPHAHLGLAAIAVAQQDHGTANAHLAIRLQHERALGNVEGVAASLWNLGQVALLTEDIQQARVLFEQSRTLALARGNDWLVQIVTTELGYVAAWQGDLAAALRHFRASLAMKIGDPAGRAHVLQGLALIASRQQYPEVAARLMGCAKTIRGHATLDFFAGHVVYREQVMASIQAQLSPATSVSLVRAGESLTWEQAIDEALAVLGRPENGTP